MTDRSMSKELTFHERYSGSGSRIKGFAYSIIVVDECEADRRDKWIWERANELFDLGDISFRDALLKARAEWFSPRDPEPWELD